MAKPLPQKIRAFAPVDAAVSFVAFKGPQKSTQAMLRFNPAR